MEIEKNNLITPSCLLTATIPSENEKSAFTFQDIPVVDLSNPDEELVARAVAKASEEWGIFQLVNHGIPTELIQRLQEVGTKFFELPETEKEVIARPAESTDIEGYKKRQQTYGDLWVDVDHLYHRIWPPSKVNYKFWPQNPAEYREVNEEYAKHIKKLSEKIMGWLSEGLGLQREALKEGLGGEKVEYLMKINYYPSRPGPNMGVNAPGHTDASGLTLLVANDVLGLQAFKDNQWVDAKCTTYGIIVNIGDQVMRMSNGKYKSIEHRATVNREKMRISWPVFVESNDDLVFGPMPELITGDDNTHKFMPYVYKDYKYLKFKNLLLD